MSHLQLFVFLDEPLKKSQESIVLFVSVVGRASLDIQLVFCPIHCCDKQHDSVDSKQKRRCRFKSHIVHFDNTLVKQRSIVHVFIKSLKTVKIEMFGLHCQGPDRPHPICNRTESQKRTF